MLGNAKFSAVIDALHARGYEVVRRPAQIKTIWPASMKLRRDADATSNGAGRKGDLPGTWCVNDHAQLFIGVDSAPAHIAAAVIRR